LCAVSHTPYFDWDSLRSFLAVVRTGRLTTAALQLQVDHSTLSRRIVALEAALQVKLFDRLPTGYVLTGPGERLVAEAEEIERVAIRISSELSEAGSRMTGSIRLATPEGFGNYFFARQLQAFVKRYPEVTLELIANPGGVSLTKRQADIAITMSRPESGPLRSQKLGDYEYGLYGSKSLLSSLPLIKGLDDARGCRLIGYIPDLLPTPEHDYLKDIFGDRQPDLRISNILTQLNATLEGYGLCVLPCFIAVNHTDLLRILPEQIHITRSYWLVTHSAVRAPARVRAMRNFLLEAMTANRSLFLPTTAKD
jgi:DNA-binding transcriptional LysR family regulator